MAKSFRPRFTLAAFVVLAILSAVALIMGGNITPYAAETPAPARSASVPPTAATPSSGPPTSASPQTLSQPTRTPSSSPSSPVGNGDTQPAPATFLPPDAMLSAGDIGAGVAGNEERVDDHGSLAATLAYCGQMPASWQRRVDSLGFRQRWLKYPNEMYTVQELSRQPSAVAAKLVSDLRAAFGGPCADVATGGNPELTSRFTILASNWGTESLLMREIRSDTSVAWRIAIRQGDLFTEIRTSIDGLTEQQARELGRRAAQRLCSATPTC